MHITIRHLFVLLATLQKSSDNTINGFKQQIISISFKCAQFKTSLCVEMTSSIFLISCKSLMYYHFWSEHDCLWLWIHSMLTMKLKLQAMRAF